MRTLPLAVFLLVGAVVTSSCATNKSAQKTDVAAESKPDIQPGAQQWDGGALELPRRSPIVAVARVDAILENARGLRSWLVAEPDMFGSDGEAFVQRFRAGWSQISRGLGTDPLSEETPKRMGLDIDRPVFLGMYPAKAAGGRAFVRTIEKSARAALDLEEDVSLRSALQDIQAGVRKVPSGLHKTVRQKIEDLRPKAGFRLVVPVSEPSKLLKRIAAAVSIIGYREMSVPKLRDKYGGEESKASPDDRSVPERVAGYVDLESRWPALVVRAQQRWVKLDVLFRPFDGEAGKEARDEEVERLRTSLRKLIDTFGAGRPAAPRSVGEPAGAVSADQRSTSEFAKMQAFQRVFERTSHASVDKRDLAFVVGLSRALTIGHNWQIGSDSLTGVSYAFHGAPRDGSADRLFRLAMTLYGPKPPSEPRIDDIDVGLGVDDRSVGLSMDLDPLFSPEWKEWLALDSPSDIVGHSEAAEDHPVSYLLSVPRNVALFLVHAESFLEDSVPDPLEPLYERRRQLQRLELGTSGLDVDSLRTNPKIAGLLSFDREASKRDVDSVLETLPTVMTVVFRLLDSSQGSNEETFEKARESFVEDELAKFPLPKSHPADPFHYYAHTSKGRSFIFFSHGLTTDDAQKEVDAIIAGSASAANREALFTRIEPAALLSALTAYDPNAMDPIDPGILAQRIGAFTLSIRPEKRDDVQLLRYEFELKQPPNL